VFDISVSYIVLAALFVLVILSVWLNIRQWASKRKLIKGSIRECMEPQWEGD